MKRRRRISPVSFVVALVLISLALPVVVLLLSKGLPGGREVYQPHDAAKVLSAAFAKDGSFLLVGGGQDLAWIHDLKTHKIKPLPGHVKGAFSVAVSGDGKRAVTAGWEGKFFVWDVASGELLHEYFKHNWRDGHVARPDLNSNPLATLSEDGSTCLLRDTFGDLVVWNIDSGAQSVIYQESAVNEIRTLAISPDQSRYYAGQTRTGMVYMWEGAEDEDKTILDHGNTCSAIVFDASSSLMATGGKNNIVRFWRDGEEADPGYILHDNPVNSLALNEAGDRLLVGGVSMMRAYFTYGVENHSPAIILWNPLTGHLLRSFRGYLSPVIALGFHGDSRFYSIDVDGTLECRDIASGRITLKTDGYQVDEDGSITVNDLVTEPEVKVFEETRTLGRRLDDKTGKPVKFEQARFSDVMQFITSEWQLPFVFDEGVHKQFGIGNVKGELPAVEVYNTFIPSRFRILGYRLEANGKETITVSALAPDPVEQAPPAGIQQGTPAQIILPSGPQAETPLSSALALPEKIAMPIQFRYFDLYDLTEQLGKKLDMKFELAGDAPGMYPPITLDLQEPTYAEALKAILHPVDLDYAVVDGAVRIGESDEVERVKEIFPQEEELVEREQILYQVMEAETKTEARMSELLKRYSANLTVRSADPLVAMDLDRPVLFDVLNRVLSYDMYFGFDESNAIVVDRFDAIAKNRDLQMTKAMYETFLFHYFQQFDSTQFVYITEYKIPPVSGKEREQLERKVKQIQEILDKPPTEFDANRVLDSDSTELGAMYQNVSPQMLEYQKKENQKQLDGYEVAFKQRYTTQGDLRRYEERHLKPDSAFTFSFWKGSEEPQEQPDPNAVMFGVAPGVVAAPATGMPITAVPGMAAMPALPQPMVLQLPKREELRFGMDIDWFLKKGMFISKIDIPSRVLELRGSVHYGDPFRFTLADEHHAFWKKLEIGDYSLPSFVYECFDFIESDGFFIPQRVILKEKQPDNAYKTTEFRLESSQINDVDIPSTFFEPQGIFSF